MTKLKILLELLRLSFILPTGKQKDLHAASRCLQSCLPIRFSPGAAKRKRLLLFDYEVSLERLPCIMKSSVASRKHSGGQVEDLV